MKRDQLEKILIQHFPEIRSKSPKSGGKYFKGVNKIGLIIRDKLIIAEEIDTVKKFKQVTKKYRKLLDTPQAFYDKEERKPININTIVLSNSYNDQFYPFDERNELRQNCLDMLTLIYEMSSENKIPELLIFEYGKPLFLRNNPIPSTAPNIDSILKIGNWLNNYNINVYSNVPDLNLPSFNFPIKGLLVKDKNKTYFIHCSSGERLDLLSKIKSINNLPTTYSISTNEFNIDGIIIGSKSSIEGKILNNDKLSYSNLEITHNNSDFIPAQEYFKTAELIRLPFILKKNFHFLLSDIYKGRTEQPTISLRYDNGKHKFKIIPSKLI